MKILRAADLAVVSNHTEELQKPLQERSTTFKKIQSMNESGLN